jgi:membrane protease YdiL (CAAX protease family)
MPGMADLFQPEIRPVRPYPGFLSAVGLCVAMLALIVVFAGIAFALGKVMLFKPSQAVVLGVVNTLAVGIVLAWGIRSSEAGWREVLPLRPFPSRLLPPILLSVAGLLMVSVGWLQVQERLMPAPKWVEKALQDILAGGFFSFVLLCVIAPLTEECLIRGLFLRGFRMRYGATRAVLYSALLFSALHLNLTQLAPTLLMGSMFAWWRLRTNSLLPGMLGHALNNAVPVTIVMLFHAQKEPPKISPLLQVVWVCLGLAMLGIGVVWMNRDTMTPAETVGDAPAPSPDHAILD